MTLGTLRNYAGSQGASTTPQAVVTIPRTGGSAVQNTDFALFVAAAGGSSNAGAAPDGTWSTVKGDTTISGGAARYAIYDKVIGSDTTITPSWPTAPGTGNNTAALAAFFSGVNGVEALGAHTVPATASTISTCTGITTLGIDRVALAIAINRGGSGGFPVATTWSTGWTEIAKQTATGNFFSTISIAMKNMSAAGATGDATCTWDFSTVNQVGLQLALTPSVTPLTLVSAVVTPNTGAGPLAVSLVLTTSGGNGNPITYSVDDWGDGNSSAGQSSNTFSHTYATVSTTTVRNGTARAAQS